MHDPSVSIIIPVYNDSKRLKLCLEALEKQTYPKSQYEVIVVDNGSEENVGAVVDVFRQARVVYENQPGSYIARNKGIKESKGEVVAFTDADCIPKLDWIQRGVASLQNRPNCGLVAGRIELFFKDSFRPTAAELYNSVMDFHQQEYLEEKHFGATANVFTFRSVIEEVGVFSPKFKSAGGDKEFGRQVFEAGYQQVYADDTCVLHPTRYTLNQLYNKEARDIFCLGRPQGFIRIAAAYIRNISLPPINIMLRAFRDKRLTGVQRKLKFVSVLLFIRIVRVFEITRLLLGGKPKR
jgi:glycosyltransferase involved in cell wall biosynthesis